MKKFKNKLAVIVILLSVCFLFLIGYSVQREKMSFVENGVGYTLNSIQSVVYNIGNKIKNSFSFITNINNIKEENEKLKEENIKLSQMSTENEILTSENERLRNMLNFTNSKNEYKYIGADIKGLSGENFLDGFTINRGSKDGIKKGMVAITAEGLVGQVTSVGSNWSIVQSLCNENIAVAAHVLSTKESDGIVKGYRGNDEKFLAEITGLSISSKIKEGDTILTSGLGLVYPKGIKIGTVLEVKEDKAAVMKSAIIKPTVDFNTLEQVLIVVPNDTIEVKYNY
ncbi:rod shape-determining protein MreC [Clostridium argentinense CDC 2741]|uniref:Cell shape-determining protein MreC n=1 Tax=Clostridium argentinense CDC 2741 TaxID=1418104 RepID=A0A0C1UIL7_9CLOT|nr:rod shape-determining protein MreC [Clostridium argentinense]ARC85579.1 rod shape-determining protein MreC [Clostridium argentinense]KIE47160.1 rod shape-determining protein MreC [Clostridium argentinense CDC 2741]NFF40094.1 rod shape-determining protein MreC [Clostridium argentinense]NFP50206.1 rod shape-determining protein MreC [Clostridium argentinense]NFP74847.1 rod shape-determining protein MreC [Clostridium argentinense]